MRPPMAPVYAASNGPRHLSPRAAVMLGLAGIMVAIAVISANYAATAPPASQPAVHASASPTAAPVHR
jgi:hypothetical protein